MGLSTGEFTLQTYLSLESEQGCLVHQCGSLASLPGLQQCGMCCAWGRKTSFLNSEWGMEKTQWPLLNLGVPLLVSERLQLEISQEN